MKYYRQNRLIIEYATSHLGFPTKARISWAVAWTELASYDKIRFIEKGSWRIKGKQKHRSNLILVDLHCNKETFIDEISRFFSEKLNVKPHDLKFRFERFAPFGDLNVS